MKNVKKIIIVNIIISLIFAIVFLNNTSEANDTGNLSKMYNNDELRVSEITSSNCKYVQDDDQKVTIDEYESLDDVIIIPDQIDGKEIEKISEDAFDTCTNLDTIKISKSLEDKITSINNFEIDKEQSNDEFIVYTTTREYNEVYKAYLEASDEQKAEYGAIPVKYSIPLDYIYSDKINNIYSNEIALPVKYDLRDYIDLKIESQLGYGICYAYASLNCVETNIALKRHEYVDLSDVHMAVGSGWGSGGPFINSDSEYYRSNIGPVYEEDLGILQVYGNRTDYPIINRFLFNEGITESEFYKVQSEIKKIKPVEKVTQTVNFPMVMPEEKKSYYNDSENKQKIDDLRKTIKEHIMKYGSVHAVINSGEMYDPIDGVAYLNYQGRSYQDHAISIVGWDDNFPKEKFLPTGNIPAEDGAYFALNSWGGSGKNDSGYIWISYEDALIEFATYGVVSTEDPSENMDITSMNIIDTSTYENVDNNKIKKGESVKLTYGVSLKNVISGKNNLDIKIRDKDKDYTNLATITGKQIFNKKATVSITLPTKSLEIGDYIIEISYNGQTISKQIEIIKNTFEYRINDDGNTITITSYNGNDIDIVIPDTYLGYKVTGISESAFLSNSNLSSVTVSNNVINIGNQIIGSHTFLRGNTGSKIEEYANSKNYKFIPLNQNIISDSYWTLNLETKTLSITSNTPEYSNRGYVPWFSMSNAILKVEISNSVTYIGNYAFNYCYNLKEINIPRGITTIGESTFYYCSSLNNVDLSNITSIGKQAFYNCEGLTEIILSNNLLSIGEQAFYNCPLNVNFNIPASVNNIGNAAFKKCSNLLEITIPNGVTNIPDELFYMCYDLKKVNLHSNITSIGKTCFCGTSISEINIPEKVTTIGSSTFASCINLKKIIIPNSIKTIGASAFYNCALLEYIVLPKNVTTFSDYLFKNCTSLKFVITTANSLTLGKEVFNNPKNTIPYVIKYNSANISSDYKNNYYETLSLNNSINIREISDNKYQFLNIFSKNNIDELIDIRYKINNGNEISINKDLFDVRNLADDDKITICSYLLNELVETKVYTVADIKTFKKLPFTDIKEEAFYMNALRYMYAKGYITGTTSTTFSPNAKLSRAMLVTILWNMEGRPKASGKNKFPDVKNGAWYTDAIIWASTNKVVNGNKDGSFAPNANITRQEVAVMLANYARYKGYNTKASKDLSTFKDRDRVASWALSSVQWAIENKIINGAENGTKINPVNNATRAEATTMIKNYIDNIK